MGPLHCLASCCCWRELLHQLLLGALRLHLWLLLLAAMLFAACMLVLLLLC